MEAEKWAGAPEIHVETYHRQKPVVTRQKKQLVVMIEMR